MFRRRTLLELTITIVNGFGLMALAAILYGTVERLRAPRHLRSLLQGLLFAGGALTAMSHPFIIPPGMMIDMRATFVAAAGAFVGPVAAVIAVVPAVLYRLWLGGPGAPLGVTVLAFAFVVGIVWRQIWFKRGRVRTKTLALLAFGTSFQSLVYFVMPAEITLFERVAVALAMAAGIFAATMVLGAMMLRENLQIAREKSLLDKAFTDPLTSLPNRRALMAAEIGLIAASQERGYVILLLDVDHFKSVNDRFGHDVGDATLCRLATILKEGSRDDDIVSRYGGEEFVLALPSTRPDEGLLVAERLLALVREHRFAMPEADFMLTVSIGLVHARGHVRLADAIARADEGLYRAKGAGRDRAVLSPALEDAQTSVRAFPAVVSRKIATRPLAQRSS